jgi:glucose/arabinose dehydrogenase
MKRQQMNKSIMVSGVAMAWLAMPAAAAPSCDPNNGGLKLPAGFCAQIVADNLGPARNAVAAANGDLYVTLQEGPNQTGGVVALRDANNDGKFEIVEKFGVGAGTGVALHNGYLYVAQPYQTVRWKMTPGSLLPTGPMEIVVTGFDHQGGHRDKGITFDDNGSMYVTVGSPSNACQAKDREKGSPGQDPCPILDLHGGLWKFDANKLNQKQTDGTRIVTGLRQALTADWAYGAVYMVMNSRDQIDILYPDKFTAEDNADRPAETMFRAEPGRNFGWPFCYYDLKTQKMVLNPEYGGDGRAVGRCNTFTPPVAVFPAHSAPVGLQFYKGNSFGAHYAGGAFIAFHGSWNRAPLPQREGNITFVPFVNGQAGKPEIFASGFAGKPQIMQPAEAAARPNGVAEAPDGSLYIVDNVKGKVWRVFHRAR